MSRTSSRRGWWAAVVVAVVVAFGVGLTVHQTSVSGQDNTRLTTTEHAATLQPSTKTPSDLQKDPTVQHANSLSHAFREAAGVAMPSVVTIHSHVAAKKVKGSPNMRIRPFSHGGENPFKGTPFEDMIPDPGDGEDTPFQSPERDGVGSGVIIDSSGIVLTNNHVVEGADSVTVYLHDGREFKATDIKTDPQSDLAVLRITDKNDFPAAHLGDSNDMEIGDWVIAIGNPFNLEETVSAGIISGKGRALSSARRTRFLQTDAAINPGNSGGPLVNLSGEVVGINTAIATNSGGYQGIGFAIPINHAKWVTEQLIHEGSVKRGYLGVGIGEMTSELANQFGVNKKDGVLISEVFPDTPAADAKLQEGDVIVKFAGQAIHNPHDVQELVEHQAADSKQSMEIVRDGKHMTVSITIKPLPENFGAAEHRTEKEAPEAEAPSGYTADKLGLEVAPMNAEEAHAYSGYEGVLIKNVEGESLAAQAGLRPGMLIRKVGKTDIRSVDDFKTAIAGASLKDGVLLQVRTPSGNRFVVLQEAK